MCLLLYWILTAMFMDDHRIIGNTMLNSLKCSNIKPHCIIFCKNVEHSITFYTPPCSQKLIIQSVYEIYQIISAYT